MRILYKPFGIIAGLIGARIATAVFKALWSRIDHDAPPKPTTQEASFPKVVGAAALEAATMAGIGRGGGPRGRPGVSPPDGNLAGREAPVGLTLRSRSPGGAAGRRFSPATARRPSVHSGAGTLNGSSPARNQSGIGVFSIVHAVDEDVPQLALDQQLAVVTGRVAGDHAGVPDVRDGDGQRQLVVEPRRLAEPQLASASTMSTPRSSIAW